MKKPSPILIILLLALLVRVLSVFEMKKFPVFEHPQLDEMEYDDWAKEIAQGIILRTYVPLHSPGYAFFLAFSHKFLPQPYLLSRLLQALISTFNVLLIFLITKKIFDPRSALLSALLASFFWPMVYFQTRLLPPTFNIFFILLSLSLILKQEKKPLISSFFSGLFLSLSAIFWPLVLTISLGLLLWTFLNQGIKRAIGPSLLLLLGLVLPLIPVMAQNYYAEKDMVISQKNFGFNFYLGNNPNAVGIPCFRPGGGWDSLQAMAVIDVNAEKPSEQNRYYLKKWWREMREEPWAWLNLLVRKTKLLLDNREIIASFDPSFYRARMVLLKFCLVNSGLVIALGLLGLLSTRALQKGASLLSLSLASFGLALILTVISSRYRMGFMALLLIPAGYGIKELFSTLFSRKLLRFLGLLGFALLSYLISTIPVPRVPDQSAYEYVHLGQAWLEERNLRKAKENFLKALRASVSKPAGYLGLAKVSMDSGDLKTAQRMAELSILLDPSWAHAHLVLGKIFLAQNDLNSAIEQFKLAVSLRPQYLGGWVALCDALLQSGELDRAEKALERVEALRRDSSQALLLRAKLALARNQSLEGLKFLKAYLKIHPDDKIIQNLAKEIEEKL